MRNEAFGRLLSGAINSIAMYEGKTAQNIEQDIGERIHVAGTTIQRYKQGHLPPEATSVEVIAEELVRRAFLNRAWLQSFLRAASYLAADELVERLCPRVATDIPQTHVYDNLPAPRYSQFVMREQPYTEIVNGLVQRSAVVLIVSLGGMGKTTLAREVAAHCLRGQGQTPKFDAVVWVSDRDRPGTVNLSVVFDEIAQVLDYPGFTQLNFEEKRRQVEQLLRRQRVLIVVDNFETITDSALQAWLLRLPEPSKAIVTAREYRRAFRNNTFVLDLRGMTNDEAQQFIERRLEFLQIRKLVSDLAQLEPLVVAAGEGPAGD